jgi:hypothetical protein
LGPEEARWLTADERRIVQRIRVFLRAQALQAKPDRLSALVVQAFRMEFPQAHLRNAYARGIPAYRKLLRQKGGSLAAADAAKRLGISVRELRARYQAGAIIGFHDGPRRLRFPVWQFAGNGLLPGLREAMSILNEAGWMGDTGNMLFFLQRFGASGDAAPWTASVPEMSKAPSGWLAVASSRLTVWSKPTRPSWILLFCPGLKF